MNQNLKFMRYVANLFRARFPFVYIPTWEEDRALGIINSVAKDIDLIKTPRQVFSWSLTTGLVCEGKDFKEDTKSPVKALEIIEGYQEPAIFVLKDFHIYFGVNGRSPDWQVIRKLRDIVTVLKQGAKPKNIVFISPSIALPFDLQKDITILDFELPSFPEIKQVLDDMIQTNEQGGRIHIDLTQEEAEKLAKAALGLTLSEAENAFARAMVEDGTLNKDDIEVILEEKRQLIKKSEILEFVKSDLNINDVGGLDNLKRWLKKRDKSWLDSAKKYSLPAPKGILITGVPGCGKSLIAKSISAMWQLPLLRLDIGKIFSGIVGSSEENMRKAIQTAEAIAPSVLWIDEIEKGFSGLASQGDSGTTSRIFGSFLTWMQEKSKAVFVVATANNINSLPAELLRKGRFDEIFFVDMPTKRERMEILQLHLNKRLVVPEVKGDLVVNNQLLDQLAVLTEGFVGAELEQIVIAGLFEAFSEDRPLKVEDLIKAVNNTVPLAITQAEQIRTIREWANVRAVSATSGEDGYRYSTEKVAPELKDFDDISQSRGGRAVDF